MFCYYKGQKAFDNLNYSVAYKYVICITVEVSPEFFSHVML